MAHIETFIQSAWQHLRADRPKQAMDCAKKALAISPNSPDVAHLLGLLASRDGKPDIALPLLQKAIDTGGKTANRLRHMAEALLDAGYAEAALTPLNDAINEFGKSSDLLGLKSAIEIALEQWVDAEQTAQAAIALNPSLMAWELNLAFAQLIQGNHAQGFKNLTARPENLKTGSFCPSLMHTKPRTIWLNGEYNVAALFYLRYIAPLVKQGWQFHLEADKKLVPLLQNSPLFLSVKEKNKAPNNNICINLGDLPLMALQCGITQIPAPLPLTPDSTLVEKYKQELAHIGPAPYIAVTWRGGPKGRKHRAGLRTLAKVIEPNLLGGLLANKPGTVISLQRLPETDEALAFAQALGKKPADYSALNNNLSGMLALLSLVDDYYTVSNTNLHLREGLGKPSHVFVNRPFQDWRWQAVGAQSIWYPNSEVCRQDKDKSWKSALTQLSQTQIKSEAAFKSKKAEVSSAKSADALAQNSTIQKNIQLINEGWALVAKNIPEAIAKAQLVLKENPEHARALHLLGWAAVQDLKFDIGFSVLGKATQLEPNNGNIWRDYIRVHVLLKQEEKAINIGQACLNNPNLWAAGVVHYALGTAYLNLGDQHLALESFERCSALIPHHVDAPAAAGMIRIGLGKGYVRLGFKLHTARSECREPVFLPYWVCPVLKGDVAGLNVLVVRSMGIGDELSYLRYLPYLLNAGVKVTYWCGAKLVPLLARLPYDITLIPDTEPMPDPANYDLAFIKNELPIAAEHLGAPEIADSLPLVLDPQKLEQWRAWLKQQGDGPYIGVTWRAGVGGNINDAFGFTRLSKKVELVDFANALAGVNATWLSLTRNITKDEMHSFEQHLGASVIDIAGMTDDLDDLLCIQALLDENIGVSNTNMHLRACLELGSKVLVSPTSGDWRWGTQNNQLIWFKESKVYRENEDNGWVTALNDLRKDLIEQYGLTDQSLQKQIVNTEQPIIKNKKIIWVSAGEIKKDKQGYHSGLGSAQQRVANVAKLLAGKGWQSDFLNENVSALMGGWHDKLPVKGDVVVFSKVFTDHAITLMQDAKARGATVILDVFNDFESQPARALHQKKMIDDADVVVSSPKLKLKWQRLNQAIAFYFEDINDELPQERVNAILLDWLAILENPAIIITPPTPVVPKHNVVTKTNRLIWITGGDINNFNGSLTSDLASTRYRVIAPLKGLEKHGWQSEILIESISQKEGNWGSANPQAGDTVVVSKVFTEHALSLAHDAKQRGASVVLDLCDNHLNNPKRGPLQKALLDIADKVITSTQALNEALASIGKKADAVISDPVEFKRGEIKFAPSKVLKLMWFGHAVNIDTLAQSLPALAKLASTTTLQLNVLTTLPNGQEDLNKIVPNGLVVSYTPWSVSATELALADCDMVIIPTLQSEMKNAKSPNRLLEPLWAGRMVVAGRLPAYMHFADSAWVGKDLIEGIAWCLANPNEVKARIAQGQADIEKYFTEQAIGQQWHTLLSGLQNLQTKALGANLKLNKDFILMDFGIKPLLSTKNWYWPDLQQAIKTYPSNPYANVTLPRVSIVIASYNHAHLIGETLASIDEIRYPNIEVVIVDDCSTDNSLEIIQNWAIRSNIKVQIKINEFNLGTGKTIQRATQFATGEYLAPFASDDIYFPNVFDNIIEEMEKSQDCMFAVCAAIAFDEQNRTGFTINDNQLFSLLKKGADISSHHFFTNVSRLFIQGCVIKKSFFELIGGFPVNAPSEDWALVIKMFEAVAKTNKQYLLAENHLAFAYRRHPTNVSKNMRKQLFRKLVTVRALTPKPLWPLAVSNIFRKEILMSSNEAYIEKCNKKIMLWQKRLKIES